MNTTPRGERETNIRYESDEVLEARSRLEPRETLPVAANATPGPNNVSLSLAIIKKSRIAVVF